MGAFQPGERVVLEHPRNGRHYATVVGPHEHDEPACMVRVDGAFVNPNWPVLEEWLQTPLGQRDMVIGDLLNLEMLKEVIEEEFIGTLWVEGDSGPMTPYVCECSFGDGYHLLTISTINQRPNYHVVRVDSRWNESNWSDGDCIGDHIDEILCAIEEECGIAGRYVEGGCDNCGDENCICRPDYETREDWPAIEADGGCSWGHIRWRWLLKAIGGCAADALPTTWAERYLEGSAA